MRPLQKGLTTKDTKRTKVNNNEKQFPLCPFVTFVVAFCSEVKYSKTITAGERSRMLDHCGRTPSLRTQFDHAHRTCKPRRGG